MEAVAFELCFNMSPLLEEPTCSMIRARESQMVMGSIDVMHDRSCFLEMSPVSASSAFSVSFGLEYWPELTGSLYQRSSL